MIRPLALVVPLAVLPACITSEPPVPVRYFDPRSPAAARATPPATPIRLRLRAATASRHLDDRMTWRVSPVEVAPDEVHRWIAPPDVLVGDALRDGLLGRGLVVTNDATAVLGSHVAAFEVVRSDAGSEAVVTLELDCDTGEGALSTERVTARESLGDASPESVAIGMRDALARAVADAVGWADGVTRGG